MEDFIADDEVGILYNEFLTGYTIQSWIESTYEKQKKRALEQLQKNKDEVNLFLFVVCAKIPRKIPRKTLCREFETKNWKKNKHVQVRTVNNNKYTNIQ